MSRVNKVAARISKLVRQYGIVGASRALIDDLIDRTHVTVAVPGSPRPTKLRRHTPDPFVYGDIFVRQLYHLPDYPQPRWILDAGAHAGLFTLWARRRFPGVPIVCVEPDLGNLCALRRNVAGLEGIIVVRGALWGEQAYVTVGNPDAHNWAFQMVAADSTVLGIPAFTVAQILDDLRLDGRGLVKLDIEGAELGVLKNAASWIHRCSTLVLELHEELAPGCGRALEAVLENVPTASRGRSGEYVYVHFAPPEQTKIGGPGSLTGTG